jgi:hypothetical protein
MQAKASVPSSHCHRGQWSQPSQAARFSKYREPVKGYGSHLVPDAPAYPASESGQVLRHATHLAPGAAGTLASTGGEESEQGTGEDTSAEVQRCAFCNQDIKGFAHNAQPLSKGWCCEDCNWNKVVMHRCTLMAPAAESAHIRAIVRDLRLQAAATGELFEMHTPPI